jgi:hypothetical protein
MWRVQFQNECVPEVLKSQQLVAVESSAASLAIVDDIVDAPASAPSRSIAGTTLHLYFFINFLYDVRLHAGEKLSSQRETDESMRKLPEQCTLK